MGLTQAVAGSNQMIHTSAQDRAWHVRSAQSALASIATSTTLLQTLTKRVSGVQGSYEACKHAICCGLQILPLSELNHNPSSYQIPRAAVPTCYKLEQLTTTNAFSDSSGGQKSKTKVSAKPRSVLPTPPGDPLRPLVCSCITPTSASDFTRRASVSSHGLFSASLPSPLLKMPPYGPLLT